MFKVEYVINQVLLEKLKNKSVYDPITNVYKTDKICFNFSKKIEDLYNLYVFQNKRELIHSILSSYFRGSRNGYIIFTKVEEI